MLNYYEAATQETFEPAANQNPYNSLQVTPELEKDLVKVFKLLADETRMKVLCYLLGEGELHVTALCDRLDQSQPAVSHHLALLRVAGLIEARRDGKHNYYSVKSALFERLLGDIFTAFVPEGSEELKIGQFTLSR